MGLAFRILVLAFKGLALDFRPLGLAYRGLVSGYITLALDFITMGLACRRLTTKIRAILAPTIQLKETPILLSTSISTRSL